MEPFRALFGCDPDVAASAPGRVNLIGEHTDYSGGLVLPTAIPQRTAVELRRRPDDQVRVATSGVPGPSATYRLGGETPGGGWLDYVQGCTHELAAAAGPLSGFDARITSTVPIGSGLSSSAALEIALLRALRTAHGLPLDDVQLALVGHRAEHDFVGVRVGVMDQMAASLCDERTALFLDTLSLDHARIPLPAAAELVVIDSGVPHAHAAGSYNVRRRECDGAAARLGVARLRDVSNADFASLPPPLDRRVRHVITENARVHAAVEALRAGDLRRLGELFLASHASMRDDFAVSIPEVDTLVALAAADPDVYGARLTGGGFGGAIVALARSGTGAAVGARVGREYAAHTGRTGRVLVPPPASDR